MADRVGQHLGNYHLTRLLGKGGFAEVYLGEHEQDHTLAAVKVLQTRLTSADDLKTFIKEARSFRLIHPNIVRLLDFDIGADDSPFLVMEYAPNGTLRQRYPRGTRLALGTIVLNVKQIAAALQYAHDQGLIHRDVKPENMLLGQHNEVLLSDFGIATIAHNTSSMSVQVATGTVPYMAPEQIQAHPRPASDQYSLGIVVYEWLSGDRPFSGSYTEIAIKHSVVPPPPLREKVPDLSPAVEQVVLTALAKDPKQRFGSVQAFANAFEQASQTMPDQITLTQRPPQSTDAISSPSPLQQHTQLPSMVSQSFIPTELIRSANQKPAELTNPVNQESVSATVLATPSSVTSDTILPVSRPLPPTAISEPVQPTEVPTTRQVNLLPLGLGAFTVTFFLFSAVNAGFFQFFTFGAVNVAYFHIDNIVFFFGIGGLIQIIAGVQSLRTGNVLAATALCSYGGFWFAFGYILFYGGDLTTAYGLTTFGSCTTVGIFLLGWTIFNGLMLFAVIRANTRTLSSKGLLIAVFGTLFLTFLLLSAGGILLGLGKIGGYLGILTALLTAILTWYIATRRSEPATVPAGTGTNVIPLGLSAFALTIFVLSIFNTQGFSIGSPLYACYQFEITGGLAIFYGGIVQLVAGVLALRTRNTFAATTFCINGGFWLVVGFAPQLGLIPAQNRGFDFSVLTILTVPIFIVALKTNRALIILSILAFFTFLTLAIGPILSFFTFILIGGWLGILLALVAWYTALVFLLAEMRGQFLLPKDRRG